MKRVRTEEEQPQREYSFSYRIATVLFPLAALLLAAAFVLCGIAYGRVRPYVTIELGEQSPRASTFAAGDANAAYRTQPEAYYKTPGSYRLWMQTGAMTVPVLLRVVDTNAPTAEAQELTIPLGTTVTPEKLVRKIRDESIVKVTFAEPVGFDRIGDFNVEIVLEDLSGNRSTVGSVLHIRAVRDELLLEAGSPVPGADAFLLEGVTAVPQSLPTAVFAPKRADGGIAAHRCGHRAADGGAHVALAAPGRSAHAGHARAEPAGRNGYHVFL